MVHALEIVHDLLRPGGLLVNIQPIGRPRPLEVHSSSGIEKAGVVGHRLNHANQKQARDAVEQVIQRGLYRAERQRTVPFLSHFDSPQDFVEWMEETSVNSYLEDETLARARQLAEGTGGESETVMRELLLITVLRPVADGA